MHLVEYLNISEVWQNYYCSVFTVGLSHARQSRSRRAGLITLPSLRHKWRGRTTSFLSELKSSHKILVSNSSWCQFHCGDSLHDKPPEVVKLAKERHCPSLLASLAVYWFHYAWMFSQRWPHGQCWQCMAVSPPNHFAISACCVQVS